MQTFGSIPRPATLPPLPSPRQLGLMHADLFRVILLRRGEHLLLVSLALVIARVLVVAIRERPRLAGLVLGGASTVQTTPSLAMFGMLLTVPQLAGIRHKPVVVARTLHALLPLLRGLFERSGVIGVDAAVDAKHGVRFL